MCQLARAHNMVIVAPLYRRHDDGRKTNTAVVIDADGAMLEDMMFATDEEAIDPETGEVTRRTVRVLPSHF